MDYNSKKRKRLKKLYELKNYDSDDKIVTESLLDNNNNTEELLRNDSFKFETKKKENSKK